MTASIKCLLALLALLAAGLVSQPAAAREDVQSDVSARTIAIESNFTGARIVVFGTIEDGRRYAEEAGIYDIVVVVRGPAEDLVSRRKSRVLGVWVNDDSHAFDEVPSYYAVLSTRPLAEIAKPKVLTGRGIGFESLLPLPELTPNEPVSAAEERHDFRQSVIRIKRNDGHYLSDERGVIFISKTLFRATLDLPASVTDGIYSVDVFLFRGGRLLSLNQRNLTIYKEGFERWIHATAFDFPLLYGIIAVLTAIAVGLSASAIFRRD